MPFRKTRKSETCLNCGNPHGLEANYCSKCGQKNEDVRVPITLLLGEFFATYFAIDSKLFKSVGPFLFKPGYLTNRFNEGKRMAFSNPLRLYVVTSVIYFFVVSLYFGSSLEKFASAVLKQDFSFGRLVADFDPVEFEKLAKERLSVMEQSDVMKMIPRDVRRQYPSEISLDSLISLMKIDTALLQNLKKEKAEDSLSAKWKGKALIEVVKDESLTEDEWLDYLQLDKANSSNTTIKGALKLRKLLGNEAYFISYVFKNLPLMMLLAIPVFGMLLKLFYLRSKVYFIEHVIHALHIHSFGYILYSFGIVLLYNVDFGGGFAMLIVFLIWLMVTFYAYKSFRKVYHQSRLKTIVKFFVLGMVYFNLLVLFLIFELYLSVLLF